MIIATHTLVFADDAEAAREFFRDVLQWPHLDTGGGWLIFGSGPSELGVHPTADGDWSTEQHHEITLMCDDIQTTVADLESRGAVFTRGVRDDGFGWTTTVAVPGAGDLMIYQPKHPAAHSL